MHPVRTLATMDRVARGRFGSANVEVPARPTSFEFALFRLHCQIISSRIVSWFDGSIAKAWLEHVDEWLAGGQIRSTTFTPVSFI
jgi:hypothetical protein